MRVHRSLRVVSLSAVALALAGCGGGGGSSNAGATVPDAPLSVAAQSAVLSGDVTKPLTIYVGFTHAALKKSPYGPVAYFAPTKGATAVIDVKAESKVQFYNDDTTRHTASGLGISGFPASFDNTSGLTASGTTITSALTWSTGSLNPGQMSAIFTVAAKHVYYFGCYFHYHTTPAMRNVIVGQ